MKKVVVSLDQCSYSIFIFSKLFKDFFNDFLFIWPISRGNKVVIITDDFISSMYLDVVRGMLLRLGVLVDEIILPCGECTKSLMMLDMIFTKLLENNCDRNNTILLSLGGGVIGDITGFAAAIYQRGIRFIQVPTTLLAQVDASIGGKTGVNHVLGKNMIGAFYQPVSVVIDVEFLRTLSVKEFISGLSEVIKYAVALDIQFFYWIEDNLDNLLNLNVSSLIYCIHRCCELKASIVSMDEYDNGVRSVLNFGHTYGHAIESCLGYVNQWSHGQAVSVGMVIAMYTALRLNVFSVLDLERIKLLLSRVGLPVCGPEVMRPEDYLVYMIRDKKVSVGRFNLILPVSIGVVRFFNDVDRNIILSAIKDSYR